MTLYLSVHKTTSCPIQHLNFRQSGITSRAFIGIGRDTSFIQNGKQNKTPYPNKYVFYQGVARFCRRNTYGLFLCPARRGCPGPEDHKQDFL